MASPGSDTVSMRSASRVKTPDGRKVGFARPTLIIPPPQAQRVYGPHSAHTTIGPMGPMNDYYGRKASMFMYDQFHGLKDFTMNTAKSGLDFGEKCSYWLYNKVRTWSRRWFTHFFLTIVLALYTVGGALIFIYIEGHHEKVVERDLRRERYALIRELRNMSLVMPQKTSEGEWEGEAARKLIEYEDAVIDAYKRHALLMAHPEGSVWTMLNAVVFCITVYTTLGYGHIYPTTTTGQALTIFYSLIGIPLFLIALTDFGKLFTRCIKFLWSFVRRLYYTGSCRKVRKSNQMQEIFKGAQMFYQMATFRRTSADVPPGDVESPPQTAQKTLAEDHKSGAFLTNRSTFTNIAGEDTDTPTTPAISNYEIDDEFNLPISVALFILVAYIFIGALGFCAVEKWNFLTSFYFVYISLSTIGFGDYVPSNPLSTILSIAYLVFGLALMSMCIDVVQTKLKDTFQQASAKLGATIGFEVDETQSITTIEALELPAVHNSIEKKDQTVKNSTETDKNDANSQRDQPNHLASPEESDVGSPNSDMNANTVPVDPS